MRTIIVFADWNSVLFWRDADGQDRIDDTTFPISDESKRELNAYYGHFSELYLQDHEHEPISDEKRLLDDTGIRAWHRLRAELAGAYKVLFHSKEFACDFESPEQLVAHRERSSALPPRLAAKPRPETYAKLEEFCRFPWFENTGKPFSDEFGRVNTWPEVKRRIHSQRWEHLQAYFHHYGFIEPLTRGPLDGIGLREIFLDPGLRSSLHQLLLSIHRHIERYDWPSGLEGFGPLTDSIKSGIVHSLWQTEYSEFLPPTAFTVACERIYSSGHMVAGWEGTFPRRSGRHPAGWLPKGRLLVF